MLCCASVSRLCTSALSTVEPSRVVFLTDVAGVYTSSPAAVQVSHLVHNHFIMMKYLVFSMLLTK